MFPLYLYGMIHDFAYRSYHHIAHATSLSQMADEGYSDFTSI